MAQNKRATLIGFCILIVGFEGIYNDEIIDIYIYIYILIQNEARQIINYKISNKFF